MIKGIVIKGMEMPDSCAVCPCFRSDEDGRPEASECMAELITYGREDDWIYDHRPDWCPLIETEIEDEDLEMQIIKDRLLRQERIREIYDE